MRQHAGATVALRGPGRAIFVATGKQPCGTSVIERRARLCVLESSAPHLGKFGQAGIAGLVRKLGLKLAFSLPRRGG